MGKKIKTSLQNRSFTFSDNSLILKKKTIIITYLIIENNTDFYILMPKQLIRY